jgi:hypothetical protein
MLKFKHCHANNTGFSMIKLRNANSIILKAIILSIAMTLSMTANAGAKRSQSVKADFQRANPCPGNGQRRGLVLDTLRTTSRLSLAVEPIL